MKNFNADSPLTRLRIKRKALTIEINNIKKELTSEDTTERKKRALLRQLNTLEINLTEIDNLIRREKSSSIKQFTKNNDDMLRTPTRKSKLETEKERQPTESNTDPDIVERNISIDTQKATLPSESATNVPNVSFSISDLTTTKPSDHTQIPESSIQSEMNRFMTKSNEINPHSSQTIETINERPTGTLPKLKRTGRILDFSKLNLSEDNDKIYELPQTRRGDHVPNWQDPIFSKPPQNFPYTLTQTNIFPTTSAEQSETHYQHSQVPMSTSDSYFSMHTNHLEIVNQIQIKICSLKIFHTVIHKINKPYSMTYQIQIQLAIFQTNIDRHNFLDQQR